LTVFKSRVADKTHDTATSNLSILQKKSYLTLQMFFQSARQIPRRISIIPKIKSKKNVQKK